jgi:dihydroneopterin aldolase
MGTVHITGLRELGVHGVLPEEQTRPQPFEVDVEMTVDVSVAGESDRLDDTVDYSAVSEAVSRVVRNERYQLLERLATRIAEVCCVDERVTVRAMVDHVAVTIER